MNDLEILAYTDKKITDLENENETLKAENQQLEQQLAAMTKDRDKWKQRAIDTYGEC